MKIYEYLYISIKNNYMRIFLILIYEINKINLINIEYNLFLFLFCIKFDLLL